MKCIRTCACNDSMKNTGVNGCSPLMAVSRMLIFLPKYDSTGVRNFIDLTATLNAAFFTARINDTDSSKRWFPSPKLVDVDDKRNEAITQETSDGRKIFVQDGIRAFAAMVWGKEGTPIFAGKANAVRCNEMSAYIIDKKGNLRYGSESEDGTKAYPYDIDSESFNAMFVEPTDKTVQGVKIMFNFDPDQGDECGRMILASELTGSVDLLTLKGLRDVYATFSDLATTGFTVKLWTESINTLKPVTVKGLLTADFVSSSTATTSKARRTNNTPADVTITATEKTGDDAGTYDVVFSVAATSLDTINVFLKKNGFDFTPVKATDITIP